MTIFYQITLKFVHSYRQTYNHQKHEELPYMEKHGLYAP
jgi:hypothetical protein